MANWGSTPFFGVIIITPFAKWIRGQFPTGRFWKGIKSLQLDKFGSNPRGCKDGIRQVYMYIYIYFFFFGGVGLLRGGVQGEGATGEP